MVLHAGSGFSKYHWNDGTSDSVLIVNSTGKYFIVANNACGGTFTDTVIISGHPPIPFDTGPDLSKCNNDSIDITLPGNFISYLWTPASGISSDTSRSVDLSPSKTTMYKIRAEKSPGCFAYDSLKVTVNNSPQIDLGGDQSFCFGDSLLLDPGPGFSSYAWNTGSNSGKIVVKEKGEYSVIASTADGCRSLDTVRVNEVFANPVVILDKNPMLCEGSFRELNAGDFNKYQWNTGENTQTIKVNQSGFYFVSVTDLHGCTGSDTTEIKPLIPLPGKFLPPDTAVCSYGSIQISSANHYLSYLWNNQATTPNLTIAKPGTYWFEVVDNNNGVGRDSIQIFLKDCMAGFYIPNSFSPNGDGMNDNFKPLLFGEVLHYEFTIYNRFGEIVFRTNKVTDSWNGKYKTNPQNSNVFIWVCKYQFLGENQKLEKGTVLLMK
jgi:gliding motility-associated-like protein